MIKLTYHINPNTIFFERPMLENLISKHLTKAMILLLKHKKFIGNTILKCLSYNLVQNRNWKCHEMSKYGDFYFVNAVFIPWNKTLEFNFKFLTTINWAINHRLTMVNNIVTVLDNGAYAAKIGSSALKEPKYVKNVNKCCVLQDSTKTFQNHTELHNESEVRTAAAFHRWPNKRLSRCFWTFLHSCVPGILLLLDFVINLYFLWSLDNLSIHSFRRITFL